MGATGRVDSAAHHRHALSIESQLLAIGSGFVVLIAIAALFVAVQQRRRRRSLGASSRDFHSPLLVQSAFAGKPNKYRASSRTFGSPDDPESPPLAPSQTTLGSPTNSSAGSTSSSSSSPQCTPMTPYASFGILGNEHTTMMMNGGGGGQWANGYHRHHHAALKETDPRGTLTLALNYDEAAKVLQISIVACRNLPELHPIHNGQPSSLNPYVKLRVLPDNEHRVKTRVLRGTNNPFYDEQFTMYGISREQLQSYTLHLAVLAFDRFSHDTVLGEAFLGLSEALRKRHDLNANNENANRESVELTLYSRPSYNDLRAQVLLSIAYNPMTNSVNLAVLKMKDLPCDEKIGQIDPYVKVYMLLNGQRVAKHKTHVKKRSTEPVFNESFAFDLPSLTLGGNGALVRSSADHVLDSVSFEVQVLNHNGVTRNEVVGQCLLGADSKHWLAVREQPGQQIAEWHRVQQAV